ncbi:UNVERIFIED_CONTAM: hypothetical protein K2H54_066196 [Gekko kuhli]
MFPQLQASPNCPSVFFPSLLLFILLRLLLFILPEVVRMFPQLQAPPNCPSVFFSSLLLFILLRFLLFILPEVVRMFPQLQASPNCPSVFFPSLLLFILLRLLLFILPEVVRMFPQLQAPPNCPSVFFSSLLLFILLRLLLFILPEVVRMFPQLQASPNCPSVFFPSLLLFILPEPPPLHTPEVVQMFPQLQASPNCPSVFFPSLLLFILPKPPPLHTPLGSSSSYSLRYYDMAIWEPGWQVPQFAALVYVNDQVIGYYDRKSEQCAPHSPWIGEIHRDDTHFWERNTGWDFASTLLTDVMILKNRYNQGIQTLQVIFGCELSGDNRTTRGFVEYGYNGKDFLSLEHEMLTWTVMDMRAKPIKRKWEADEGRPKFWKFFLEEICVEGLRTLLRYGEVALLKKEPPTVKVTRKAGHDGLETLVCWLSGFYPKEIDVTWQKDGEDWKPDTLTGGVIPNADGTYHTWLSVEVEPEERGRYLCHVEHDALQEPLDLAWEDPSERQFASSVSDLGFTGRQLGGVTVGAVLLWATINFSIRRH